MKTIVARKYLFGKLFVFFLLINSINVQIIDAQIFKKFNNLSVKNGLSQNTVYCIEQDSKGFMWFGTQTGLNRFDGKNFKNFYSFVDGEKRILRTYIFDIKFQKINGTDFLWLATKYGLIKFNLETETSEIFNSENTNSFFNNEKGCNNFLLDNQILWIGTNGNGLQKLNTKTNKCISFNINSIYNGFNIIKKIIKIGNNKLLILSEAGISKFNIKNNSIENIVGISKSLTEQNKINTLIFYKDNYLLATDNGFKVYNQNFNKEIRSNEFDFITKFTNGMPINTIYLKKNKLYLGTNGDGLIIVNLKLKSIEHIKHNSSVLNSLSSNVINEIYIDSTKTLWLATKSGGVNFYNKKNNLFFNLTGSTNSKIRLPHNSVYGIYQKDKSKLWIGTINGLLEVDLFGKDLINLPKISTKYFFKGKIIADVLFYKDYLWVASNFGLYRKKIYSNKWERFISKKNDENTISSNNTYSLYGDSRGYLWVGTRNKGLNKFDFKSNKFTRYSINNSGSIKGVRVYGCFEDSDGILWVSTDNGLSKYNYKNDSFETYLHDSQDINSISHSTVRSVFEDSEHRMWVGTTVGLDLFDKKSGHFRYYTDIKNMPHDWVYRILEDKNKNLWFTTNNGLFKINPETKKMYLFLEKDGLQSNEFNLAAFKNEDGGFYFGGIGGLSFFYPDSIKENFHPINVEIIGFSVFNKEVGINKKIENKVLLKKIITYTDTLNLNYSMNVFSFDFIGIDYTNTNEIKYAYKLEGFEDKWNYTSNRNYVTYTNLHPGTYKLKIKAANKNGYWFPNHEKVLVINILPPFYLKTWFIVLLVFVLIMLVFGIYFYRTRLLRIRAHELKQKIEEQTKNLLKINTSLENEITEREKINAALIESKEKYQYLVENINDVIFSIENDKIIYISPTIKTVLGFNPIDLEGKKISDFIFEQDKEKYKNRLNNIEPGKPINNELRMLNKKGELRWIRISEKLIFKENKIVESQGVMTDITEKKNLESQLIQSQKLESIGQLAAGIAHEINTPIQFIGDNTTFVRESFTNYIRLSNIFRNMINAIEKNVNIKKYIHNYKEILNSADINFLNEEIPTALSQTLEGVARVSEIVKAMKAFSHPGVEEKTLTNINDAIKNTIIVARNEWKYIANLITDLDNSIPDIPCLPGLFNQVILNLIINACHAIEERKKISPEKGEIKIKTKMENNFVVIEITDNGIGIPKENETKIFDPFYTTKEVGKGTGQGLSIAYDAIVNKHNGEIYFESEKNVGTTFIIKIPPN